MNEKQIEKFKMMCKRFVTQDHHMTRDPIYIVQSRSREYTDENHSPDGFWLLDGVNYREIGPFELNSSVSDILHELDEYVTTDIDKYIGSWDRDELVERLNEYMNYGFEIFYFKYVYENRFYSLFEDDAKDYMIYQSHNLHNPRIYVDYIGYGSCGLMNELYKLMEEIGNERS